FLSVLFEPLSVMICKDSLEDWSSVFETFVRLLPKSFSLDKSLSFAGFSYICNPLSVLSCSDPGSDGGGVIDVSGFVLSVLVDCTTVLGFELVFFVPALLLLFIPKAFNFSANLLVP